MALAGLDTPVRRPLSLFFLIAGPALALNVALAGLPLGARAALWNCWQVLRSRRRRWAKAWSIVLALACLFLLWIGILHHLPGYGAFY
jgi:hypothetical protein